MGKRRLTTDSATTGGTPLEPRDSKSGRGGRIRTGDPLRPSATSCNYPRLSATTQPQVVDSEVDLTF